MVADSADDGGDFLRLRPHLVQQTEGHHRTTLGVVDAVDHIADIMEIPGDVGQLRFPGRIPQRQQNIPGLIRHQTDMGKAMLGITQSNQVSSSFEYKYGSEDLCGSAQK